MNGLYFHIPYCKSKCPYCDFYSIKYDRNISLEYINALCCEIEKYQGEFDTIYFGGGTPSIIDPQLIGKLIDKSKTHFHIDNNAEITIECNPSKDLRDDFKLYKSYNINRISLGMQSANERERYALGRIAGKAQIKKAIFDARNAGIENISLDVMLGTPNQTITSLDETFEFIDEMKVNHISAYMLKIEENTPFFKLQDKLKLPDEDTTAKMYLKTIDVLRELGFNQYEISNFSRPGFESRHNLKYWTMVDYLGIGATAHSLWKGKRFYYDKALKIISDGESDYLEEKILLGLRLNKGIDKNLIKKDYSSYIKNGFLIEKNSNIALTPKGMLVSNIIISDLL